MAEDFYDDYWKAIAPTERDDATTPERKRRLAAALAKLPRDAAVLDLGCGRGAFTAYLKELGYSPLGVDISSFAIEYARRQYPACRFDVLEPNGRIPLPDKSVKAVWSSEVIEHIFDVHAHLAEINRVLDDGGLYVLTTPYHGVLKNVLLSLTKFDRHFDPELSHIRFFDKAGLQRCLSRAGFEVLSWGGIGRLWFMWRTWFVVAEKRRPPGPPPPIRG